MQGTQYATKRSILCRGAFCGPTVLKEKVMGKRKFFSRTRSGVPLFLPILSHIRAPARGKDKKTNSRTSIRDGI